MPEILLRTKLFIPPLRPNLVRRPHLIERLNQGLELGHILTLVSAPAGFGKTTLVSEWVAGGDRPAAWLSLDEGDNDFNRFLVYLVAAMQTVSADIGGGTSGMLHSPQQPSTESILTSLINDITAIPDRTILILDDYHIIDSASVDNVLAYLLEHLPPQLHLVITTRSDPKLTLARYRARGQLTELRAADLRFASSEADGFLNRMMSLNLSAEEVTALETRTEGWIAGLQLAALSIQGREEVTGFIRTFAGDNRYIVDYLTEEVLKRQPQPIRSFLLKTAIIDRLCGPLCDAVTGQEDGTAMLEALERGNLFVVPLDDKRQWYRYHHLFADVLQTLSKEEQPNEVPPLHRRASKWYEQNGLLADAIRHALAAKDFERAADLVELTWPEMDWSFQSATWLDWAKALPDELVCARPVLSVGLAWALLNVGELEAGEAHLNDAERWLDAPVITDEKPSASSAKMVVVDEEQFRSLPATIASARAYYAQALRDVPGTVKHARRALDLLSEDDLLVRGRLAVLLGLAYWSEGDLEAAYTSFADAMTSFQTAGNILFAISFTFMLAEIRMAQGRLHEARSIYERSLQLARQHDDSVHEGVGDLHLGLSELSREQGDLGAARQYLLRSEELGEQGEVHRYHWCRAGARMKSAQGDLDGALDLLDEADRWLHIRTPIPDVRPISAMKTGIWVLQGRLTEALSWVRERGLSVDDELNYLNEFEYLTFARVLIAHYESDSVKSSINGALQLLHRLLKAAEDGGRTGSAIEILVVTALAYQAQGDVPLALVALENALTLAEPEGYVRIFVDEGTPMKQLLLETGARGIRPDYTSKLLAGFREKEQRKRSHHTNSPALQQLAEPLSQRELEVLRLLKTELSGPEIARELAIALSTVRTHTQNIYSKLGVSNRLEAIRKAEELGVR